MRSIEAIENDITELKKYRKVIKKDQGKHSISYAEITDEIEELKDELKFTCLYTDD